MKLSHRLAPRGRLFGGPPGSALRTTTPGSPVAIRKPWQPRHGGSPTRPRPGGKPMPSARERTARQHKGTPTRLRWTMSDQLLWTM